ncbi:hypothetical protein LCGC14_0448180 [marine sediment metagenome]|uniref:Twin-arginine translocation signal domain-containing protein n=1 Tax=marine sediment metagenome TaxID=412755 RepID=A0A0F9VSU9_9ZZZZ
MINRRSFLKSLVTVCGAAVVCPGELLKDEPVEFRPNPAQKMWMRGKDGAYIEGYGLPRCYFRGTPIYYRSPLYDETNQT